MRASHLSAAAEADNRHWLHHQRSLELELMRARERQNNQKRSATGPGPLDMLPVDNPDDGWTLTYLDLMTLLLVMVLAMLAMTLDRRHHPAQAPSEHPLDVARLTHIEPPGSLLLVPPVVVPPEPVAEVVAPVEEAPPPAAPEEPGNPLADLPLDQLGSDIEVIRNESSVSFRIDSSILFPSGQTDLDPEGLQVLERLARVLRGIPHRIVVAGHTDNRTIRSDRYPSNWELSGARAGSVVRFLQQQGIASSRLTAVGMAATLPLADNGSVEGRAKNRRVELTLAR